MLLLLTFCSIELIDRDPLYLTNFWIEIHYELDIILWQKRVFLPHSGCSEAINIDNFSKYCHIYLLKDFIIERMPCTIINETNCTEKHF